MAAIASRPATRAIALLTPEAIPALDSSASDSTAAVSGATVTQARARRPAARRQQIGEVVVVRAERSISASPRPPQRPEPHEQPRSVAVRQPPHALGQQEHHDRRGQQREPRVERAVAGDLLEEQHEQEERDAEAAVHRERLHVPDREVAPPEQAQREHRRRRAPLVGDEHAEQDQPADPRSPHLRGCPSRRPAGGSARAPARRGRRT